MGKEIEKKYLLWENGIDYTTPALKQIYQTIEDLKRNITEKGQKIKQGYLPIETGEEICDKIGITVDFTPKEARLRDKAGNYYFTMKGEGEIERNELDEAITKEVFETYWPKTKGKRVEKIRLTQPYKTNDLEHKLEIDMYTDRDLIVAEIEAKTKEETEKIPKLGKDVTEDQRYKNKNLTK